MCIIIDADQCDKLANPNAEGHAELQPVKKWIGGGGIILFSRTSKFQNEFNDCSVAYQKLWKAYEQSGRVKQVNSCKVQAKTARLEGTLKSNDEHIIALALVSGAKALVSGDGNLHEDFKNKKNGPGGKVYPLPESPKQGDPYPEPTAKRTRRQKKFLRENRCN